jgi:hypothetical protein
LASCAKFRRLNIKPCPNNKNEFAIVEPHAGRAIEVNSAREVRASQMAVFVAPMDLMGVPTRRPGPKRRPEKLKKIQSQVFEFNRCFRIIAG